MADFGLIFLFANYSFLRKHDHVLHCLPPRVSSTAMRNLLLNVGTRSLRTLVRELAMESGTLVDPVFYCENRG
jgi:hypothetical protein